MCVPYYILPLCFFLPGTTRVSRFQKKHSPTHTYHDHQSSLPNNCIFACHLLGFLVQSEHNTGRCTNNPDGRHPSSRLIGAPTSAIPPILCQMPFLAPQSSQFLLAWDRHQVCWLAYLVAWLMSRKTCKLIPTKYCNHFTATIQVNCVIRQPQLEDFIEAKFYCLQVFAVSNYRIHIRQRMPQSSPQWCFLHHLHTSMQNGKILKCQVTSL